MKIIKLALLILLLSTMFGCKIFKINVLKYGDSNTKDIHQTSLANCKDEQNIVSENNCLIFGYTYQIIPRYRTSPLVW